MKIEYREMKVSLILATARDDADSYALVLPQLADLIINLESRTDLWGAEWTQLQQACDALGSGRLRAERFGTIGEIRRELDTGIPSETHTSRQAWLDASR